MTKSAKLNYDDITIVPEPMTTISSRSDCNPWVEPLFLPIFTAPMGTVVDENNYWTFLEHGIYPVIPVSVDIKNRTYIAKQGLVFVAFSLSEVKDGMLYFINDTQVTTVKICIDVANGHMGDLLGIIKSLKEKYHEKITIMAGNIANPNAYKLYDAVGCDYVRVGIGGGEGCLTSSNTGIHYPYFSLLKEMYDIKMQTEGKCKIIADGNIKGYCDIQKALINADYVMIGGLFNRAIESASKTLYGKFYFNFKGFRFLNIFKTMYYFGKEIPKSKYPKVIEAIKHKKMTALKLFYGESTKIAQIKRGRKTNLKTSEGIVKYNEVEYSLKGWVNNEVDYLRSAMSYTDSHNLEEYKQASWVKINNIRYNK